jgi:hypothetical protein
MTLIKGEALMFDLSRRVSFFLVLFLGLAVFLLGVGSVSATGIDPCRGDPILQLSNGKMMTLAVDILAPIDDIKQVQYTVHLPKGVTAAVTWPMPDSLREKEELKLHDDAKPGEYKVDVYANIKGKGFAVIGTFKLDDDVTVVTGTDNEHLRTTFIVP